jgi:hypothetical protein
MKTKVFLKGLGKKFGRSEIYKESYGSMEEIHFTYILLT